MSEKKKIVLIVEDCRVQSEAIRLVLKESGYEGFVVGSAEDAIAVLKMNDPEVDVVVTDVVLPKKSGFDLLTWAQLVRPDVPFVITTAHSSEVNCRKSFRMGAAGYSPKSELTAGFVEELEEALRWHESKADHARKLLEKLSKLAGERSSGDPE